MNEVCVRVAVRIRPLLPKEVLHHHQVCVRVVPGSAQVRLGSDRLFSFDHVFGPTASQDEVYQSCVQPLVESLVDGYNATVFCYGQTGSGKTFTLGGRNQDEEGGIIDRVAQDVFLLLEKKKSSDGVEARVHVSYLELYREELRDLLELQMVQKELHIREDERGNTVVVGAREMVVTSAEELLSVLEMGNAVRHTDVTGMNDQSSRSHAILTLQVNICCHSNKISSLKSIRSSKLCLVDLAGSERAGKTENTGSRLKESAHINTGLLALGNVIRALSDHGRSRRSNGCGSAHIPYRDAKITRLLRDSLGGNAHTLMVACVSPSHHFMAESLNVLKFATKARCIRNCPGKVATQTHVKSDTWNPTEARLEELEYEVKTLRELLKEKEQDIEREREKTGGQGRGLKQSSQIRVSEQDQKVSQETAGQCCLLAHEAAALLADISAPSPCLHFKQQLQNCQERLTTVSQAQQTTADINCPEGCRDKPHHLMLLKLTEELYKCQDALRAKERTVREKDAELEQRQKEAEKLLEEKRIQGLALEEQKKRTQIQSEQLVNQQILIDHLRNNLIMSHGKVSGATVEARTSGYLYKRPHSVPLLRHSCVHRPTRKIHSSPPAYSLERVMAAFKMRGHLLLAELEEKDEVYCPFIKHQAESSEMIQETEEEQEEEDEEEKSSFKGGKKFRRSLNRTWTNRSRTFPLKGNRSAPDNMHDGNTAVQRVSDAVKNQLIQTQMKNVRRSSTAERRIHELTVNMRMKEELIRELDKTEKETQAVDRHTMAGGDVLVRLSMQSRQVRAEVYRSLQHMRLQRARLQSSLRPQRENAHSNRSQDERQMAGNSIVSHICHHEESNRELHDRSWLDEEEERVFQKRVELQELEEEQKSREEVLLSRDACLQQKNKLETNMLHFSQALSRDLLRVSMQLESVQEQLQSSNIARKAGVVTREELEKERDMLKMKRDTLGQQLRDNRVLTAEEEHSLLQLEEAVEALDAALEFKNQLIENKKQQLLVSNEPAEHCNIFRKLKKLSPSEALELLVKYFNKVVCLREVERCLRLRCEELELHAGEQEAALKEMEAAMQRLALDTDRRLTQQHKDHQNNIQLLLQKLKEGVSGEAQQTIQDRLQHLEKELFFYRSSSRQLKKKLKEFLGDALHPDNQPSHTQEQQTTHNMQMSANKSQPHSEDIKKATYIATTYTKIYTELPDAKTHKDLSECQEEMSEHNQNLEQARGKSSKGQSEQSLKMTPVRLSRSDLRQISPADLQVFSSATRRQQSVFDSSTESMMEDSIEVPRNTDR